jgi:HPt (histidine-containing phosphotransfer) domain-containing protein
VSDAAFPACEPRLLLDIVNGERAVFRSLAEILKRETLLRFDAIVAAAAAGDARAMGFAAHSLKGTVGTVGAARAVAQLLALEQAGLREERVCDAAAQANLRLELQAIRDEVDDFLSRL